MILDYLRLVRIWLIFTAVADPITGYLLGAKEEVIFLKVVGLLLVSGTLYCAGMVLNDIVDIKFDRVFHPDRPLVKERVKKGSAIGLCLFLAIAGLFFSALLGIHVFLVAGVICGLIVLYNMVLKGIALLGSINMGAIRGANFCLGIFAHKIGMWLFLYPVIIFIYVFILTFLSSWEQKIGGLIIKKLVRGFIAGIIVLNSLFLFLQAMVIKGLAILFLLLPTLILFRVFRKDL